MSLRSREENLNHWHGTAYATKCEVRSHPQKGSSGGWFPPPKRTTEKSGEWNNSSACTDQPLLLLITDRTELI
ncbi:hypothetical protein niasHS_001359 [Heterodera schachtii]|uniref:Uncharacterized protein n=1 Tax=Heterodera schachtii TaxID=97005 RepID=A0ABD2KLD9_HETSC